MPIICPVCSSKNSEKFPVSFTFIRHQDFMPMSNQPSMLFKCALCQTIYLKEQGELTEIEDMYRGAEYARKKKTEHFIFEQKIGVINNLKTTYSRLAELIAGKVPHSLKNKDSLRFLDVGCFDGKLLLELNKIFPQAAMHGFDVSNYIADLFPRFPNFKYYSVDLEKIEDKYDVITLINVLCYVNNLPALITNIRRLLKSDGFIFFVCTDIEKNPYFLTCGDQYTFQTPINLKNLLYYFGYDAEFISGEPAFPRSILGIARKGRKEGKIVYEQDYTLPNSLEYLDHAERKILRVASNHKQRSPHGRIVVLGCTNNAAWANNIAGDYVDCFTDEHPKRIGEQFYRKDVIHPNTLTKNDLLIIPYAKSAKVLADKFEHLYNVNIVNI